MRTTIDAREFEKILLWRGCEFVRDKGGHRIYRTPEGTMIVSVCPGRPTKVKRNAISNAAKALGLTANELLGTKRGDRVR